MTKEEKVKLCDKLENLLLDLEMETTKYYEKEVEENEWVAKHLSPTREDMDAMKLGMAIGYIKIILEDLKEEKP